MILRMIDWLKKIACGVALVLFFGWGAITSCDVGIVHKEWTDERESQLVETLEDEGVPSDIAECAGQWARDTFDTYDDYLSSDNGDTDFYKDDLTEACLP